MKTAFYKLVSIVFLLASVGTLAGVYHLERRLLADLDLVRPVAWKPDSTSSASDASLELVVSPATLDLTPSMARPLMSQSRKPFVASAVVAPEPVVQSPEPVPQPVVSLEGYRLMGIFDDGGAEKALIATPSLPAGSWIKASDVIEGFVVKDITANVVTLEQQGQQFKLQQYVDKQN